VSRRGGGSGSRAGSGRGAAIRTCGSRGAAGGGRRGDRRRRGSTVLGCCRGSSRGTRRRRRGNVGDGPCGDGSSSLFVRVRPRRTGTRSLRRRHVPGTSGGRRAASSRGMSVGCRRSVRPAAWVACRVRPRQVRPRLVPGTRHGSRGDVGFGPASARGLGQPRGPLRLCRTARGVERLTRLTPRPWSARGAGATGSSPDPEAACAGRACPCGWSRGTGRHRRRGHRPRSAPR
jgi:hypothetical protein